MAKDIPIRERNGNWHIVRRVPVRYSKVEPRSEIWVSLKVDSESLAKQKAPRVWNELVAAWEAKLNGDTADAEKAFEAAHNLAKAKGFRWLSADKVAALPQEDYLARFESVRKSADGQPNLIDAAALLGGAREPAITIRKALETYFELSPDKTRGMSEDQIRRWKNPRKKAIKNLVSVIGNKTLPAITRDDMLDFRAWWADRLEEGGLTPNSANKDIGYVENTLRTVNEMKRLGLDLPFGKLTFKEDDKRTRLPFSEHWIKTKLLAPGALDGLNDEARAVVHIMVNTGARPSEIVGLLPHHIRLDEAVPVIEIAAEGKKVKAASSKRIIPLIGISLAAAKAFPQGFPTYRFKDKISDAVNKFFRENGLKETPQHTLYGLRHAFEDRMLNAGVDERVRRDLMGHSLGDRQRYGQGGDLAKVHKMLKKIAH
jgi:integrase